MMLIAYGLRHYVVGSSVNSDKGYMHDSYSWSNDEHVMYQNGGIKILPSPLMRGKSISVTQLGSSTESVYRPGAGEERTSENDERLIYQAALEVLLLFVNFINLILLSSMEMFIFQ